MPLRAIVGARVSVVQGTQKVSHIAQQETGLRWVAERGHEVVGTFLDLDVSASISPFDRPDLGPWLSNDKSDLWDLLVLSKIDRMFRSTRDCVRFAEWAELHKKILVFAEDGLTLNYRDKGTDIESMMSELFIYIGSFFAQLELNRFRTRALDGHRVLRTTNRWASGVPPLGFKVVDHPDGKGKGLDRDQDGYVLLHNIAGKLMDGWSFIQIAAWCNDQGLQTNMGRAQLSHGKTPPARPWSVGTIIDALTSPKTQGFKMHKREPVLDPKGEMIRMGPPTFDSETWKQIQDAAQLRQINRRTPARSNNPMLGVGFCGKCGAGLAQQFTKNKKEPDVPHRYYRCSRTPLNCNGVFIKADVGDELLQQTFLEGWGSRPVTRRVFVPGEDHSEELDQVTETIARLRRESDSGLVSTAEDERIYFERMASLIQRRDALSSVPRRAAGWVTEEIDTTYAEAWLTEDHRGLLVDRGIKFILDQGKPLISHLFDPQRGKHDTTAMAGTARAS